MVQIHFVCCDLTVLYPLTSGIHVIVWLCAGVAIERIAMTSDNCIVCGCSDGNVRVYSGGTVLEVGGHSDHDTLPERFQRSFPFVIINI